MTNREKVLKGLECLSDENNICSKDTCPYYMFESCVPEISHDALDLLKEQETELQKKQSEQKYGHWVLDPDGMDWGIPAWCCSECHCRNDNIPPNIEKVNPLRWSGSKFCPNCGAQMER